MNATLIRAASSLLIFLVAIGAYGWWYNIVRGESEASATLAAQIASKIKLTEDLKNTRSTLAQLSGDEDFVRGTFISNATIVPFIEDLEHRGDALSAKVHVVSVAPAPGKKTSLSLSLSINGSFSAVIRTMGAIEYAPYDITTMSASVNGIVDGEAKTITSWSGSLEIQVGSLEALTTTP